MATYYIDARTGNDGNAGTSEDHPFASLSALDDIKLTPGDSVLLARGSRFSETLVIQDSGHADAPITFGAYGHGARPMIEGPATGIYGSGTHDIVVQDIGIARTSGYALFASGASNWNVEGIDVDHTGSSRHSGAISFEGGDHISLRHSTIAGVTGDGVLVNGTRDLTIADNDIRTVHGPAADNLQIAHAHDVTISGNHLDLSGQTDSTKGNLVVNGSDGVAISGNTMVGGAYGASVNSDNVTIAGNHIYGQAKYGWTYGIGLGNDKDIHNYDITGNDIHDVNYGVAITGTSYHAGTRSGIEVEDNRFYNIAEAALKLDRPATGEFSGNQIDNASTPTLVSPNAHDKGGFVLGANARFASTAPDAHSDTVSLGAGQFKTAGRLLGNDTSHSGEPLHVSAFDGQPVDGVLTVAGHYGTARVYEDGHFVYYADPHAIAGLTHPATDSFTYVTGDGTDNAVARLAVNVSGGSGAMDPVAANDTYRVGEDGSISGNVLDNDHGGDGAYLRVDTAGKTYLGHETHEIVGRYGTLTIAADGDFHYEVDAAKVVGIGDQLHEVFMYKMSDGSHQDAASLGLYIDPMALSLHFASDHM